MCMAHTGLFAYFPHPSNFIIHPRTSAPESLLSHVLHMRLSGLAKESVPLGFVRMSTQPRASHCTPPSACPLARCARSIKDILYKKRMERELLRAKGLLSAAEKPPEEVRAAQGNVWGPGVRLGELRLCAPQSR